MPMAACSRRCSAEEDAIISDALNHASIIDGVRLCKAKRYRYANSRHGRSGDRAASRPIADGARFKLIATDGVFSMDGHVANLAEICALAERYGALVMVDDCHATGHLGEKGSGTPALTGVGDRVDIVTGTFGKTLGGGMGGFIAAAQPVIDLLRQRARPYLFSNSLRAAAGRRLRSRPSRSPKRPTIAARSLMAHARRFRDGADRRRLRAAARRDADHPGDARRGASWRRTWRAALDERGVYVAGFFYPVVPKGKARIRTQMSAALTEADVDFAIDAFTDAGKALGVI